MASEAVHAQLAMLSLAFRGTLPPRMREVEAAWQRLAAEGGAQAAAQLRNVAHGLVGSAGTFGLPEVGDAARPIDLALAPFVAAGEAPPQASVAPLEPAVAQLLSVLRANLPKS